MAQLVSFIKSSIQQHNPDKDVAESVAKLKITNKLEAETVDELAVGGRRPQNRRGTEEVEFVQRRASLRATSASESCGRCCASAFPSEQKQILDQLAEQALNYTANLPNFICTQLTRRHVDPTGTENYSLADTVQEQLTYFDRHESYKVTMVNNTRRNERRP